MLNVAVALRKAQRGLSMADEHDYERITSYCRQLGPEHGVAFRVVLPAQRDLLKDVRRWDGFLFVGADDFTRKFVRSVEGRCPTFLWAKGYDLTLDGGWRGTLDALQLFFNSSYLSAVDDRYNDRTHYVPTAFHHPWRPGVAERVADVRNRFADAGRFDLVFSGSDRHVRSDQYRQRLLNLLAERGVRICVAAPRSVWNRPRTHDAAHGDAVALDRRIAILGNWGTEQTFRRARFVLDLPWLDNVFHSHFTTHNPNQSVFALGWNIFRAGAYGACLLTFDCPVNRALGLTEEHCRFYRSDIGNLDALADEIAGIVTERPGAACADRQSNLRRLFHARHTYLERWAFMCREIGRHYARQAA